MKREGIIATGTEDERWWRARELENNGYNQALQDILNLLK